MASLLQGHCMQIAVLSIYIDVSTVLNRVYCVTLPKKRHYFHKKCRFCIESKMDTDGGAEPNTYFDTKKIKKLGK